jgi:uncharacterized protein YggE
MKFKVLLFLIALFPMTMYAQNETFKGEHFIEVTGIAQQEIEPNEIYFTIRLKEFEENREKTTLEKLDKDFFNAVKEAGIDKKRVELADAGSTFGKIGKRDKDAFREKTYQIKFTSAAELENFISKLQNVKVDYADIIKLSHSDLDKIKVDLKVKALQAAKTKAEYLLKSIGAEAGKPLMVRDWDVEQPQPMMQYKTANVMMDGGESNDVGFRKIKLQAQITAQFEIK